MSKKILVYGGSFDPPHIGHMWLLLQAMEFVQPDEVLIAPTWSAPLKDGHQASYDDRREMLRLSLADFLTARRHDLVRIWDFDLKKKRQTYSHELIDALRSGNDTNQLFFLVGSDILGRISEWKNVDQFAAGCTLVVGVRPGSLVGVPKDYLGAITFMPHPTDDESSTEARRRLSLGETLNGVITPSVIGHISRKKLYSSVGKVKA